MSDPQQKQFNEFVAERLNVHSEIMQEMQFNQAQLVSQVSDLINALTAFVAKVQMNEVDAGTLNALREMGPKP